MSETSHLKLGRYALVRKLGRGGMATVYFGRTVGAEGFRKPVSVKLIHPHLMENSEALRAFIREAKLAARLVHPNIVQVLDFGEEDHQYLMVLEYVHGYDLEALASYLTKVGRPMRLEHATFLIHEVLRGLEFAHNLCDERGRPLGVIHCDINPHNVLISTTGQVKLSDFGVAQVREELSRHTPIDIRGTLAYQSPEQVAEGRVEQRSDLFALGTIFFELLTGTRLFYRGSSAETVMAIDAAEVPDVRDLRPSLPSAVNALLARALAREPEGRFQNAEQFASALRDLFGTAPPSALEPSFRAMIAQTLQEPEFLEVVPPLPDLDQLLSEEPLMPEAAEGERSEEAALGPLVKAHPRAKLPLLLFLGAAAFSALVVSGVLLLGQSTCSESEGLVEPQREPDGGLVQPGPEPDPEPPNEGSVSRALRARRTPLERCLLDHGVERVGEDLVLVIDVDSSGAVSSVSLEPQSLSGTALGGCLTDVARTIRFSAQPGQRARYRVPIRLR